MGSEQLSTVMETVGKSVDPELKARIEKESEAIFSSAHLWDDGVIAPAHTRAILANALEAVLDGKEVNRMSRFGIFRM